LRAIAVIAVVIFHFDATWLPGGFAGVDVFFVISGYLMTKIIFEGIGKRIFSITDFYKKRAKRIVPALSFLCLIVILFGWFLLIPVEYEILSKHVLSSLSFVSNFIYWNDAGYFSGDSKGEWLLHTWSLSTEWQFYLIYPILNLVLFKHLSKESVGKSILVLAVLSFLFSLYFSYSRPSFSYYLLPSRAWQMLVGGLVYIYPIKVNGNKKHLFELLGLIVILACFFLVSDNELWPGYFSVIPVFGSALILQLNNDNSIILKCSLIQYIGKWSYSIYLWHWPIAVIIYTYSLSNTYKCLGVFLSVFFGFLSYRYVESTFRNKEGLHIIELKTKLLYIPSLVIFLSIAIYLNAGLDVRWRSGASNEAAYLSRYHVEQYKKHIPEQYKQECNFFDAEAYVAKANPIPKSCIDDGKGGIFIWGDSHAQALSYGLRDVFSDVTINQVATSGCRPLVREDNKVTGQFKIACDLSNDFAKKAILEIQPEVIVLAQRGEHEDNDFNEILNYLKKHEIKSKIVLIGPVPQWRPSLPLAIATRHFDVSKKVISDKSLVSSVIATDLKMKLKYQKHHIEYVSLIEKLCNEKGCLAKVDDHNTPLVWDYGHLSKEGAIFVMNNVVKQRISPYLH